VLGLRGKDLWESNLILCVFHFGARRRPAHAHPHENRLFKKFTQTAERFGFEKYDAPVLH